MAKKKENNIVITDKELTPTIIGKIDNKEKSPIILLFVFAIFIVVALFLPDITNFVDKLLKDETIMPGTIVNNSSDNFEEEPNELEEVTYYDYRNDLVINNNNFKISNIVVDNNIISFDLTNVLEKELNLEELKIFLELYTADTTLLQRIKISYGTIAINETKRYNYDIDDNTKVNFQKLLIVERNENDYPEVVLNKNEESNGVLTCIKGHETITYTFGNDYLVSINDLVNYPFSNDLTYTINLQEYQLKAANYKNYEGISSTIVTLETGFTYTTLIDLKVADITNLENYNYYPYRTLAKTVKFETESNGFSCN